jgi:hypothetical protein
MGYQRKTEPVERRLCPQFAEVRTSSATAETSADPFTANETKKLFNDTALRYMGISGDEFLPLWDSGVLGTIDDHTNASSVAKRPANAPSFNVRFGPIVSQAQKYVI